MDFDLSKVRKRHRLLMEERQQWEGIWQEISDFISPYRGRFSADNKRKQVDYKKFIDEEPYIALRTLAAGMQSGLTSPARPWFRLGLTDPELTKYHPVRLWIDEVEYRMIELFNRTNLYNSLHSCYTEEAAFGTACVICLDDPLNLVRFKTLACGEYSLAADESGRVNTFARSFTLSTIAIIEAFGIEKVPMNVKYAYDNGNTESQWEIDHLIEPNDSRILNMPGVEGMAWRSVYFMKSNYDKPLSVSGYEEFPVMAPRWEVIGNDVYGSESPGMMALGASMMLQAMQNDTLEAIEKMVNPPLQGPADSKIRGSVSFRPGAVNYYNEPKGGAAPFSPLFNVNFDINGVQTKIQEAESRIQRLFYTDLFRLLQQNQSGTMTATEVKAIIQEKMLILGPVIERQEEELLSPAIERTFNIMCRAGAIPPPPDEVLGHELRIEYISTLAQAQKAMSVSNIERIFGFVNGIASVNPNVLDAIDTDEAVFAVADAFGAPAKVIRSKEAILAIRQERAEAQQQEQLRQQMAEAAQMAPGIAKAAQSLGDTNLDNLNNMGGAFQQ